jgi:hypothetical protein
MDNDVAGILNVDKIASKLGAKRTKIVKNNIKGTKDANDVLKEDPCLIKLLIQKAQTIPQGNTKLFSD